MTAEAVELLTRLAEMLIGAGAVYGGIRNDLRRTRAVADEALRAAIRAHDRLDNHIGRRLHDGDGGE